MQREIKFRARRMDDTILNGRWVYGHYFTPPLTDENSGLPAESGWYFLSGGERRHCIEQYGVVYTVDPKTIGQFTGLLDKNSVEIYEGDIISTTSEVVTLGGMSTGKMSTSLLEILWNVDGWANRCISSQYRKVGSVWSGIHIQASRGEVIGNIYEHPELLEKEYELHT